jgi:hypothetical protein
MLEPRINDLRSETGYGLDEVPILSNSELTKAAWQALDEILELKARQKRAAMALPRSTEPTPPLQMCRRPIVSR